MRQKGLLQNSHFCGLEKRINTFYSFAFPVESTKKILEKTNVRNSKKKKKKNRRILFFYFNRIFVLKSRFFKEGELSFSWQLCE